MTISLSEPSENLQAVLVDMAYKAIAHHVGEKASREKAARALDDWKAREALDDSMCAKVLAHFWPASAMRDIATFPGLTS